MSKSPKIEEIEKLNPYYRQHLRDERVHIEELLNQRFNLFIIILGAIITSFPAVQSRAQLQIIFIAGFIFEFLFTIIIGRDQKG